MSDYLIAIRNILDKLPVQLRPIDLIDILIVGYIFYQLFLLIRGTRAIQVIKGLAIFIVIFVIAREANFHTITWLLTNFGTLGLVAIVILFQPEIRHALANMGQNRLWGNFFEPGEDQTRELIKAVFTLAKQRIGALIVIARKAGLRSYIETGVTLNARFQPELLTTIFIPKTPLHDGAVIIEGNQIVAASCLLPLTQDPELSITFGTRHRAAIGLTEETDALVIVVSEERGEVSLAVGGNLSTALSEEQLSEMLILY
ncbi:MAG: diadenylate cyclase CdaA [bacterium]|nr:diadenylate cyclase CdaA [bacterium]